MSRAEEYAVDALHTAFAALTPERTAHALLVADTEALGTWLCRLVQGYRDDAYRQGWNDGYARSERDTAEAWTPVAERVRRSANQASYEELLQLRGEEKDGRGGYRPVRLPEPLVDCVEAARRSWGLPSAAAKNRGTAA